MKYFLPFFILISSFAYSQEEPEAVIPPELRKDSDIATPLDNIPFEKLRDMFFEQLLLEKNILTPEQRAKLQELERQKIEALKNKKPATPVGGIIPVSLKPGAELPTVYVTPNWDTHITIVDKSGKPWPIKYISGGSDADFPVKPVTNKLPDGTESLSHVVKVESLYRVGSTNLSIWLHDLNEMFNVLVVATKDKYHPKASLQLDLYGPNTEVVPEMGLRSISNDKELKLALMGGSGLPKSYQRIKASHPDIDAWLNAEDDTLILRSRYYLASPRPQGIHSGPGGYHAYRTRFLPVLIFNNEIGSAFNVQLTRR